MEYGINRNRLDQLDIIRTLAFLGVFLQHTSLVSAVGAFGVSLFFIMSGFLMVYNNLGCNKIRTTSIKDNYLFSKAKISKLYPLHIVTMISCLPFVIYDCVIEKSMTLIGGIFRILSNIVLLQEWIPINNRSINSVSWFLCVMAFLYFLFPYIEIYIESKYSKKRDLICISVMIIIQLILGMIGDVAFEGELSQWLIYYFPLSRFPDFFIGCILGRYFLTCNKEKTIHKSSVFELSSILVGLLGVFIYSNIDKSAGVWWRYSLMWVLPSSLMVLAFARGNGIVSKLLCNKLIRYLAKISPYAYLIHNVVIRYINATVIIIMGEEFNNLYGNYIKLIVGFFITVLLSQLWIFVIKKVKKEKAQNISN